MAREQLAKAIEKARTLCVERGMACWTVRVEKDGSVRMGMGYPSTESAARACKNAMAYAEFCGAPCSFEIVETAS